MTRPQASRYPVASFGPELMEILLRGAREKVDIPCPNQRFMKHLQARIHMLRGAMAREKHHDYGLVTHARTSRSWNKEKGVDVDCVLTIRPNDSQFTEVLAAAGIVPSKPTHDILNDAPLPARPPDPSIESSPPSSNPYERFK